MDASKSPLDWAGESVFSSTRLSVCPLEGGSEGAGLCAASREESMHAEKGEGARGGRLARLGEGGGGVRGEGGHALALGGAQRVQEASHIPQRVE